MKELLKREFDTNGSSNLKGTLLYLLLGGLGRDPPWPRGLCPALPWDVARGFWSLYKKEFKGGQTQ